MPPKNNHKKQMQANSAKRKQELNEIKETAKATEAEWQQAEQQRLTIEAERAAARAEAEAIAAAERKAQAILEAKAEAEAKAILRTEAKLRGEARLREEAAERVRVAERVEEARLIVQAKLRRAERSRQQVILQEQANIRSINASNMRANMNDNANVPVEARAASPAADEDDEFALPEGIIYPVYTGRRGLGNRKKSMKKRTTKKRATKRRNRRYKK